MRLFRRLDRWDKGSELGVMSTSRAPPLKSIAVNGNGKQRGSDNTKAKRSASHKQDSNGDVNMEDEDLDDMEKEILGLASGEEGEAGAEDLDDVDKELLGLGADETEEEGSEGGMEVDS
jgi:Ino eighty subunit 1